MNKIAIIGAGASGVAALRQAVEQGLDPTVFEARASIGGAWILANANHDRSAECCSISFDADRVANVAISQSAFTLFDDDKFSFPTSTPMYPSLRTNVPTLLMQYNGISFPPATQLFPGPNVVENYISDAASNFLEFFQFNTHVSTLRWTTKDDAGDQRRWTLETQSTLDFNSRIESYQFDFVIIANGHYQKPYIPFIEGLDSFPHDITHARFYHSADSFAKKNVLVVGSNASGYDITREIAESIVKKQVTDTDSVMKIYQSRKSLSPTGENFDGPENADWCKIITVLPTISKIQGPDIAFCNGTILSNIDTIIFATGYYFSFPFANQIYAPFNEFPLTKQVPLPNGTVSKQHRDGGLRVHYLDSRDIFYLPDPTLALIGLPYHVLPLSLAQIQSRVAIKYFTKQINLEFQVGTPEEYPETREALVYGHPKQYDVHDALLKEIGEGGEGDGLYCKTPQYIRDLRVGAFSLRRAVLGY